MPTVPDAEEETDVSLAAQAYRPKMASKDLPIARPGRLRFPIGQMTGGSNPTFRDIPREMDKATAEEQNRMMSTVPGALGRYLGSGWDKFVQKGYKSPRVIWQEQQDKPGPIEQGILEDEAKARKEKYFKETKAENKPLPVWGQPNMKDIATKQLGLNEQEQNLYDHHLENLRKGGIPDNRGGTSTLLPIVHGEGDKSYIIPTVWNNQRVSSDQAVKNAKEKGLDKFPSYDNETEATARYFEMHDYLERDTK